MMAMMASMLICFVLIAHTLSQPTILDIYPTFHSIGITISFNGTDSLSISEASVWYKEQTEASVWFIEGHECTFGYLTPTQQFLCNIMSLNSNTIYNIQIRFTSGPFNGDILTSTATTKNENNLQLSSFSITNTYYVTPQSNSTQCLLNNPCSISTVLSKVVSNDEIICLPGTYYFGQNTLPQGVILRAQDNEEVIFDGSLPKHIFEWTFDTINNYWYADGIILTPPFGTDAHGVIANDQRLFPYQCLNASICTLSLIDLGLANFSGFYYDIILHRMYVKFGGFDFTPLNSNFDSMTNPNNLYFEISQYDYGFKASDNTYFYGLIFQNYGSYKYSKGIYISGKSNVIISNCYFKHCSRGIGIQYESNNIVIQYNTFVDSKFDFLWEATKATKWVEGGAFEMFSSSISGRGVVFRYNILSNFFDCINAGGSQTQTGLPHETDIYGNILNLCADDGMSLDGQCSNCRVWNNTISKTLSAISVAPLYFGPIFLFRNVIYYLGTGYSNTGYKGYPFKTNSGEQNSGKIYIYHNTVDNTQLTSQDGMQIKNGGSWELIVSRNNIYLGTNYAIRIQNSNPIDFDYDCSYSTNRIETQNFYYISFWKSFSEFKNVTGQETNGMYFKPVFNNINNMSGCYELHADNDSLLIDTAQIIPGINNIDFIGNKPDIGAFEYGIKNYRCNVPTLAPTNYPTNIPSFPPTYEQTIDTQMSKFQPTQDIGDETGDSVDGTNKLCVYVFVNVFICLFLFS
eukprot:229559_1